MSSWKERLLSAGIAIVLVLFVFYGIFTFQTTPKYENFCEMERAYGLIENQTECEKIQGAKWNAYIGKPYPAAEPRGKPIEGYCDVTYQCNKDFQNKLSLYNRNVFFVTLIAGGIALIAGFLLAVETVGNGVMFGGIVLMIAGTVRYWNDLSNPWKFVILGIVLTILVLLGYKRLTKQNLKLPKKNSKKK